MFALDLKTLLRWSCFGSAFARRGDGDGRLEVFELLWDFPDVSRDGNKQYSIDRIEVRIDLVKRSCL